MLLQKTQKYGEFLLILNYVRGLLPGEEASLCVSSTICRGATGYGLAIHQHLSESSQGLLL